MSGNLGVEVSSLSETQNKLIDLIYFKQFQELKTKEKDSKNKNLNPSKAWNKK